MAYWWRHIDAEGEPTGGWYPCEPRNIYVNTVQDTVVELLAYRYQGKPCYEVRELCFVTSAQAALGAQKCKASDAYNVLGKRISELEADVTHKDAVIEQNSLSAQRHITELEAALGAARETILLSRIWYSIKLHKTFVWLRVEEAITRIDATLGVKT